MALRLMQDGGFRPFKTLAHLANYYLYLQRLITLICTGNNNSLRRSC
jgi:hypothetical protein